MGQLLDDGQVPRLQAAELSYAAFLSGFMFANQPVLMSGATRDWQACRQWIDAEGRINFALLMDKFGASIGQVADCSRQSFSDQERLTMTLADFIAYWQQHTAARTSAASPSLHGTASSEVLGEDKMAAELPPRQQPKHTPHDRGPSLDGGQTASDAWEKLERIEGGGKEGTPGLIEGQLEGGQEDAQRLLYLKDWHFAAEYPEYRAYETPVWFQDDWLNEYLDQYPMQYEPPKPPTRTPTETVSDSAAHSRNQVGCENLETEARSREQLATEEAVHCSPEDPPRCNLRDSASECIHSEAAEPKSTAECADYRFVYMGPAGSWTPCHADVLRSHSWSANVCGRKRWRLLPPDQAWMLFDRYGRSTVYDIDGPVDPSHFPHFRQTRWLECVQEAGEAIFVPSGWFHQVTNLDDTISINHNWLNGYNLHWAWELLKDDYRATVVSIEDCRELATPDEFEELCQRNLQLNSGTNFADFFAFVATMALDRARKLLALADAGRPAPARANTPGSASELVLGLNCACKVLREVASQNLYLDSLDDQRPSSSICEYTISDSELLLGLPRHLALSRGPLAVARAVEMVLKNARRRWSFEMDFAPKEVVRWRR